MSPLKQLYTTGFFAGLFLLVSVLPAKAEVCYAPDHPGLETPDVNSSFCVKTKGHQSQRSQKATSRLYGTIPWADERSRPYRHLDRWDNTVYLTHRPYFRERSNLTSYERWERRTYGSDARTKLPSIFQKHLSPSPFLTNVDRLGEIEGPLENTNFRAVSPVRFYREHVFPQHKILIDATREHLETSKNVFGSFFHSID